MAVGKSWTNPESSPPDLTTGQVLTQVAWEDVLSNQDYMGGADGNTHSGVTVTATTPYTVTTDWVVAHTAATPTVHLPTTHVAGRQIIVKHRGSGTCTVDVNGGASGIFTTAAVASVSLGVGDSYTFLDDGTYYLVV